VQISRIRLSFKHFVRGAEVPILVNIGSGSSFSDGGIFFGWAVEVRHHSLPRIVVHVPKRFARVAVIEVVAPAPQEDV
jgi:hypothetical protein